MGAVLRGGYGDLSQCSGYLLSLAFNFSRKKPSGEVALALMQVFIKLGQLLPILETPGEVTCCSSGSVWGSQLRMLRLQNDASCAELPVFIND